MVVQTPPNGENLTLPYAFQAGLVLRRHFDPDTVNKPDVWDAFASRVGNSKMGPSAAITTLTQITSKAFPGESLNFSAGIVLMWELGASDGLAKVDPTGSILSLDLRDERRKRTLLDLSASNDKRFWTEKIDRLDIEATHGVETGTYDDFDLAYCIQRVSELDNFQAELRKREEPTTTTQEKK